MLLGDILTQLGLGFEPKNYFGTNLKLLRSASIKRWQLMSGQIIIIIYGVLFTNSELLYWAKFLYSSFCWMKEKV